METLIALFTGAAPSFLPMAAGSAGAAAALIGVLKWLGHDLAEVRKALAGFVLPMAGLLATHFMEKGFGAWPDMQTMAQFAIVALAVSGGVFALPNAPRKP